MPRESRPGNMPVATLRTFMESRLSLFITGSPAHRQDAALAALDGERLDDAGGPFAELHRPLGVDLVAHGNDGGELVVLCVVGFAVGGSYPKILDN